MLAKVQHRLNLKQQCNSAVVQQPVQYRTDTVHYIASTDDAVMYQTRGTISKYEGGQWKKKCYNPLSDICLYVCCIIRGRSVMFTIRQLQ